MPAPTEVDSSVLARRAFREAPMLAERVARGELPAVAANTLCDCGLNLLVRPCPDTLLRMRRDVRGNGSNFQSERLLQ